MSSFDLAVKLILQGEPLFCSDGEVLIVDLNTWGEPTSPLLMLKWDRDWQETAGLKLIEKPVQLKGDVKVSF